MSSPTKSAGTGWTISTQQEEIQVGDNNQVQEGYRVYFRTQYGVLASVWLSRLNYTSANIRNAVTQLATSLDTTHTMTG